MRFPIKAIFLSVLLAGCGGGDDVILPGAREAIRADETTPTRAAQSIRLSSAQVNANWTHRLGGADHRTRHPALGRNIQPVFSVKAGAPETRRTRITADPIVASGAIFTMDAQAQVVAHSTGGQLLWTRNLVPLNDGAGEGAGGGLAFGDGKLIVTTGFGRVTALDPSTGGTLWTQKLEAPGGSSPTVANGLVYVAARDAVGWALDADTGRIRWTLNGTPSPENFGAGPGVAANGSIAIFPFASGEVLGAFPEGGLRRWSSVVTGARIGYAASTITDISGDPVIDGSTVYVGNISGRAVAMNAETGERLWTVPMAAKYPVWPAGGSVFLVNDVNELVRLDARDGAVIWKVTLPQLKERRFGRSNQYYAHYGPVLAGGRLIVASSDGMLRHFDPSNGALVEQTALPAPAASGPAVAGGVLYVMTTDGLLTAFR